MRNALSVYEQISQCMVGHEPPKVGVPLGEEAGRQFEGLHRPGRSHRVRRRAYAVLLSVQGYTLDQIADILRVDRDAVSRTPDRWEEGGVAALEEVNRAAGPKRNASLEAEMPASAAGRLGARELIEAVEPPLLGRCAV